MATLTKEFFEIESLEVAKDLIGKMIIRDYGGDNKVGGIIYQTDAYALPKDFKVDKRTKGALYPPATIHMYPSQSGHTLAIATLMPDVYNEILIRQMIPMIGIERMLINGRTTKQKNLGNGPIKLVKSLGLNADWDSRSIAELDWGLSLEEHLKNPEVIFEKDIPNAGKDFVGRYTLKNKIFPWSSL